MKYLSSATFIIIFIVSYFFITNVDKLYYAIIESQQGGAETTRNLFYFLFIATSIFYSLIGLFVKNKKKWFVTGLCTCLLIIAIICAAWWLISYHLYS